MTRPGGLDNFAVEDDFEDVLNVPDQFEAPDDFNEWLDEDSSDDTQLIDSDYDPEEARDGLGELKTFMRPSGLDKVMSIVFLVDTSGSMKACDVGGSKQRRIAVVRDIIINFIQQQQVIGAIMDRYTLVTFNAIYKIEFQAARSDAAMGRLKHLDLCPGGGTQYNAAFDAVASVVLSDQRCRVIMLSDGQPDPSCSLPALQHILAGHPLLDIHTIGFGDSVDFSVLQQIAQIGRGSFQRSGMDTLKLMNTFTTVSKTLTQTRTNDYKEERPIKHVSFESAGRVHGCGPNLFNSRGCQTPVTGTRYTFFFRKGQLAISSQTAVTYWIRKMPFMQGGMRLVYRFKDGGLNIPMVAKFSKYKQEDASWDYVMTFVRNTVQARSYSKRFHEAIWAAYASYSFREPRRLIAIAQCFAYESSSQVFVAEPFLRGSEHGFVKWSNNRGEILVPSASTDYIMAVEAFAHFSLDASKGRHMVSDLQGVVRGNRGALGSVSLTDPQMLSCDGSFGAADLGVSAMQKFCSLHVCSPLCRKLRLSSLCSTPRAPRTTMVASGRRTKPPLRKSRPEVRPEHRDVNRPAADTRGRDRTARHLTENPVRHRMMADDEDDEMVTAEQLLLTAGGLPRKLLFVGEYTHLFSAASLRFVKGAINGVAPVQVEWWSTALQWPSVASLAGELTESVDLLRDHGAHVYDGVDFTDLKLEAHGLQGAIWVMAWPPGSVDHTGSARVRERMQDLVTGFVKSAAGHMDPNGASISVVFMAMQHLAWKLPAEIDTAVGVYLREVFWFGLSTLHQHGYRPRFGDSRDRTRTADYHTKDEVVIARWRRKLGADDYPRGMTDQRVRSESAARRSLSRSQSGSRGRSGDGGSVRPSCGRSCSRSQPLPPKSVDRRS